MSTTVGFIVRVLLSFVMLTFGLATAALSAPFPSWFFCAVACLTFISGSVACSVWIVNRHGLDLDCALGICGGLAVSSVFVSAHVQDWILLREGPSLAYGLLVLLGLLLSFFFFLIKPLGVLLSDLCDRYWQWMADDLLKKKIDAYLAEFKRERAQS